MADLILFEADSTYVIQKFRNGHFDYIEVIQEVAQRDFFRYVDSGGLLRELAETYPSPRRKSEVPTWFYLAADMAVRLHGNHAFHGFPWVVNMGGLLSAFGPSLCTKHVDKLTGEIHIECLGFNRKNNYPHSTPCHHDSLRKMALDTKASNLLKWYNGEVQQIYKQKRFFDKGGIFIADGSYLFVPDNPNYEGSALLYFDEHNRPVSKEALASMPPRKAARVSRKRCYKLVTLLHTNETGDFFLYAGIAVVPGNKHESPILWDLIDDFVSNVGKGSIKHLILDRGFIDGENIGRVKQEYGIDTTIGIRSNMDIYKDVAGLATLPETSWQPFSLRRSLKQQAKRRLIDPSQAESLRLREEKRQQTLRRKRQAQGLPEPKPTSQWITKIDRTTSFSSCSVPLDVVICTDNKDSAAEHAWAIMTTAEDPAPIAVVERYHLRTVIEERHRHIKCFWDITDFKSPNLNMVVNQIVFTLLTYTLLQQQLLGRGQKALNKATKSRLREKLVPIDTYVTVYTDQRYAIFTTYEYTELVMSVPEKAHARLSKQLKKRNRELFKDQSRAPPSSKM